MYGILPGLDSSNCMHYKSNITWARLITGGIAMVSIFGFVMFLTR